MGVGVEVDSIDARISLTDLNLIQRVTGSLGAEDSSSCWQPHPRAIGRSITAANVGGKVKSELAEVKVQVRVFHTRHAVLSCTHGNGCVA